MEQQLRTLKMPHARTAAPELLAMAKSQRWEPVEVLRALLTEELAGKSKSVIVARRKAAKSPSGKTFKHWDQSLSTIAVATQ